MSDSVDVRRAALAALVDVSEQMLERARKDEWDEVPAMEAQRRQGLEAFLASAVTPEEAVFVKPALEKILQLDRELITLSQQSRDEAAGKLKELHQGRRAQAAYDSNRP